MGYSSKALQACLGVCPIIIGPPFYLAEVDIGTLVCLKVKYKLIPEMSESLSIRAGQQEKPSLNSPSSSPHYIDGKQRPRKGSPRPKTGQFTGHGGFSASPRWGVDLGLR